MALITSRKLPDVYTEKTCGGPTRDYQDPAVWWSERCDGVDMVTATSGEVLTIYDDEAPYDWGNLQFGDTVGTYNADDSYFPVIRAAPGHKGTKTSGVRIERIGVESFSYALRASAPNIKVYDIAGKVTGTHSEATGHAFFGTAPGYVFAGCIAYDVSISSPSENPGVGWFLRESGTLVDCVGINIYGAYHHNTRNAGVYLRAGAETSALVVNIYNTTLTDSPVSFGFTKWEADDSITLNLKNTIYTDGTAEEGSGTVTINETTNATTGVTFAADGYSLDSTDTGAIDQGTDLSADADFAFNDDFFGTERPKGTAWDIGAHEYASISGTLKEKESGSGSPEHYILINELDGSVIEAGTAAADGSFEVSVHGESHTLIMPDKDGEYAPVAASLLEGV